MASVNRHVFGGGVVDGDSQTSSLPRLSRREAEVLSALGERLTNAEIGDRLFLSVRTVETYVSALLRKLGAANRRELADIAQQQLRSAPKRLGRALPPRLAGLLGRAHDVGTIRNLLRESRLLTLTGPAGVGKTRLALELAATLEESFAGGAVFVDITPASDEATVQAALAGALDSTAGASDGTLPGLLQLLAARPSVLLVIDNCEHLLGPVSELVVSALGMNESLSVLATSRETLAVPGERVFAVRPLDEQSSAELFRTRAAVIDPLVAMDDVGTTDAITSICRRLDGMPLAIELAAAQVVALTPRQIDARLNDRFALLRAPARGRSQRHAALETALAWSYDLLTVTERVLLDRLAVFRGRFGVEAVEAVATDVVIDHRVVVELLASLVRKSLVVAEFVGDERRFRLLETVREYGWVRLSGAHELDERRQRHLDWVLDLLGEAADGVTRDEQALRFARLDEELANVEAAFEWSLRSPEQAARALSAVLGVRSYWIAAGIRRALGGRWLHATSMAASSVDAATSVRALLDEVQLRTLDDLHSARALADAARTMAGDDPTARAYAALAWAFVNVHRGEDAASDASEAISMIADDDMLHWWAQYMLALDEGRRGLVIDALSRLRGVVGALRGLGDEHVADGTLTYIADFELGAGDVDAARSDAAQALESARRFGCASCESQALIELALIDHRDAPGARLANGRRALRLAHSIGETWNVLAALDLIAAALADDGQVELAVTVGAAASKARATAGLAPVLPTRGAELERAFATARAIVDPATFADCQRDGAALDFESAIALAGH